MTRIARHTSTQSLQNKILNDFPFCCHLQNSRHRQTRQNHHIFGHNFTTMTYRYMTDRYMILVSLPMISGARYQIKFSNSVFQPF